MKIALFYGTCTGKTEAVATLIKEELGDNFLATFDDISQIDISDLTKYDVIIAGIPTWDVGELQYDWADLFEKLDSIDLSGKICLMFGTGDQSGYPDTYQDAMGMLYDKFIERGATGGYGFTSTDTHEFIASKGVKEKDGVKMFCGLAIDEDCQSDLTEQRVKNWCAQIKAELKL